MKCIITCSTDEGIKTHVVDSVNPEDVTVDTQEDGMVDIAVMDSRKESTRFWAVVPKERYLSVVLE